MLCAISTGHSLKDPGAIAINGMKEYELNVDLVNEILGFKLIGGRFWRSDYNCEDLPYPQHLHKTVKNINAKQPACCFEIHHNGVTNKKVRGAEIIYWGSSDLGRMLACKIADYLKDICKKIRVFPNSMLKDDKGKIRRLYFLAKTICPAVIIEPGYITNYEDLCFIQKYRLEIADLIRRGVCDWIRDRKKIREN